MLRRSVSVLALLLYGVLAFPINARADTALTQAVVETIRNQVQILQSQSSRSANVSDVLVPGDGLTTANDSLAELRFNDGSLGRLGEQVVFWFTAGTRNFSLSNGTVLLLIPPGQGRTTIQTPNASAGIQGSALFVRYIEETDTTVVGALTDSNIQVMNEDSTQQYTLSAGEMAVAVGDRITDIYEFDLQTFYETSSLARDLAPDGARNRDANPSNEGRESEQASDPAIAAVQEEMDSALQQQEPIAANGSIETPSFLRLPDTPPAAQINPASDPLAPRNANRSASPNESRPSVRDRMTSGSPINDPGRTFIVQPQGRDLDDIPSDRGPRTNPGLEPDNNPGLGPDDNPGRGPNDNPGLGPDDNPGRGPDDNPGRGPNDNPGRGPNDNPDLGPDDNPGRGPNDNPGRGPNDNPGLGPDDNPGRGPDDNPGRGPNDNPGRGPDDNPGLGPDDNPGRGPNNNPGRGPDNNPGLGPDNNPGLGPDNNPGRGPNNNPGRGPNNAPGRN
jgi:hypothetical protein